MDVVKQSVQPSELAVKSASRKRRTHQVSSLGAVFLDRLLRSLFDELKVGRYNVGNDVMKAHHEHEKREKKLYTTIPRHPFVFNIGKGSRAD